MRNLAQNSLVLVHKHVQERVLKYEFGAIAPF